MCANAPQNLILWEKKLGTGSGCKQILKYISIVSWPRQGRNPWIEKIRRLSVPEINPPAFGDAHTDFTRCLIIRAWNFRAFTFLKLINPIIGSKDINNNFVKKKREPGYTFQWKQLLTILFFAMKILLKKGYGPTYLWNGLKRCQNIVSSSTALADNVCKCHTQFTVVMQTDIWIQIHRLISQAPFGLQGAFIPL